MRFSEFAVDLVVRRAMGRILLDPQVGDGPKAKKSTVARATGTPPSVRSGARMLFSSWRMATVEQGPLGMPAHQCEHPQFWRTAQMTLMIDEVKELVLRHCESLDAKIDRATVEVTELIRRVGRLEEGMAHLRIELAEICGGLKQAEDRLERIDIRLGRIGDRLDPRGSQT